VQDIIDLPSLVLATASPVVGLLPEMPGTPMGIAQAVFGGNAARFYGLAAAPPPAR
jgi:hypothetical protein